MKNIFQFGVILFLVFINFITFSGIPFSPFLEIRTYTVLTLLFILFQIALLFFTFKTDSENNHIETTGIRRNKFNIRVFFITLFIEIIMVPITIFIYGFGCSNGGFTPGGCSDFPVYGIVLISLILLFYLPLKLKNY